MQKIIPNLWFDNNAKEAVDFYVSIFKHSRIGGRSFYGESGKEIHGHDAGEILTIEFEIEGQDFLALNGGPEFKFSPAVSFLVACKTMDEVVKLWDKLIVGGSALMELGKYPFSDKYGWLQDKFGLSWQIMFMGNREIKQKITPTLMFVGSLAGKAEEAINFYKNVFSNPFSISQGEARIGEIMRYGASEEPDREGTIKHAEFTLLGQEFAAMDSAWKHEFGFNEAVSLIVLCETQEEIDFYWDKLIVGGDPTAQVCGWLKDKFGLSWQITPTIISKMLADPDAIKRDRVMTSFLEMKKIKIADLEEAYK